MLLRRLAVVGMMIVALSLSGCGAVAQFRTPCPGYHSISDASWSSDGTQLSYTIGIANTKTLYVYDIASGRTTEVGNVPYAAGGLEWSPNSNIWLLQYAVSHSDYELISISSDGTTYVFPEHFGGYPTYQWSPDGQQIAVTSRGQDQSDLLVLNPQGQILWRLADSYSDTVVVSPPAWSPDSAHIAFEIEADDGDQIGIINAEGSNLDIYSLDIGYLQALQWSPDHSKIAFISYDTPDTMTASQVELNVMETNSGNITTLAQDSTGFFRWLPNSVELIQFTNTRDFTIVSVDGESLIALDNESQDTHFPNFSPNGTLVVYRASGQYYDDDLYVMNIDGTDVQQITHNPGNTMCFHWPF